MCTHDGPRFETGFCSSKNREQFLVFEEFLSLRMFQTFWNPTQKLFKVISLEIEKNGRTMEWQISGRAAGI